MDQILYCPLRDENIDIKNVTSSHVSRGLFKTCRYRSDGTAGSE